MNSKNKTKMIFSILVIMCLGLIGYDTGTAVADDTGWKSPSSSVAGGQYTNPDNAFSSDNAYATNGTDGQSQLYANFGFSIPSGSTINGIEVTVEGKTSSTSGGRQFNVALSGDSGSNFTSEKTTGALTTSDSTHTLGGNADLWSGSWNQSNFTNDNFRVKVISKISGGSKILSLDHIQVKVHYSPSTAVTLFNFTAETNGDDIVTLSWQTATETDNAGFNIYRSRLKDGNYKKLNSSLIPSEGNEVEGASYRYEDTPPSSGTYYYKLEDVDYNETSTMHGPEKVRVRK